MRLRLLVTSDLGASTWPLVIGLATCPIFSRAPDYDPVVVELRPGELQVRALNALIRAVGDA